MSENQTPYNNLSHRAKRRTTELISHRIRELRINHNIERKWKGRGAVSQEKFAQETNLSFQTIHRMESGKASPRIDTLKKVAAYHNMTLPELLDGLQVSLVDLLED